MQVASSIAIVSYLLEKGQKALVDILSLEAQYELYADCINRSSPVEWTEDISSSSKPPITTIHYSDPRIFHN